jgi:hypothetical protein
VPEKDRLGLIVTDMLGRVVLKSGKILDRGMHSFRFITGGGNLYFFTAQWRGTHSSIKILHTACRSGNPVSFEYLGSESSSSQPKTKETIQEFVFTPGDELLYIAYAGGL